jgi:hypothetical protein
VDAMMEVIEQFAKALLIVGAVIAASVVTNLIMAWMLLTF